MSSQFETQEEFFEVVEDTHIVVHYLGGEIHRSNHRRDVPALQGQNDVRDGWRAERDA